jgi:hypothetical protein
LGRGLWKGRSPRPCPVVKKLEGGSYLRLFPCFHVAVRVRMSEEKVATSLSPLHVAVRVRVSEERLRNVTVTGKVTVVPHSGSLRSWFQEPTLGASPGGRRERPGRGARPAARGRRSGRAERGPRALLSAGEPNAGPEHPRRPAAPRGICPRRVGCSQLRDALLSSSFRGSGKLNVCFALLIV